MTRTLPVAQIILTMTRMGRLIILLTLVVLVRPIRARILIPNVLTAKTMMTIRVLMSKIQVAGAENNDQVEKFISTTQGIMTRVIEPL